VGALTVVPIDDASLSCAATIGDRVHDRIEKEAWGRLERAFAPLSQRNLECGVPCTRLGKWLVLRIFYSSGTEFDSTGTAADRHHQ
jgi:hypothetical protein